MLNRVFSPSKRTLNYIGSHAGFNRGFKIMLPHQIVSKSVNAISDDHKTIRFPVKWPNAEFEVVAHPIRQIPYGKFSVEESLNMISEEKPDLILLGTGMEQYLDLLKEVSVGDTRRTKRVPDIEYACMRVSGMWSPIIMRCVADEIPLFPVSMNRSNLLNLVGSKLWRKPIGSVKFLNAILSHKTSSEVHDAAKVAHTAIMVLPTQYMLQQTSHTLRLATRSPIQTNTPFKDIPGLSASTLTAGGRMNLPEKGGKVMLFLPNFNFSYAASVLPLFLNGEAAAHTPNYPLMLILNFQKRKWLYFGATLWAVIPLFGIMWLMSPVFSAAWKFIVDPVGITIGGDEFIIQHDLQSNAITQGDYVEEAMSRASNKNQTPSNSDIPQGGTGLLARIVSRAQKSWAVATGGGEGAKESSRD